MMIVKVLVFLFLLVSSLFLILYSDLMWQVIIVYGKQKVVLNFWFALILFLLLYVSIHFLLRKAGDIWSLPCRFKRYRQGRRRRAHQYARSQALMYALAGEYDVAVGHMKIDQDAPLLSDLILYATWVNKNQDLNELDRILGLIQATDRVPNGWMIWFRAYLLFERGKKGLACALLLDALDSGVATPQVIKAFAQYVDPREHYQEISKHYTLMCRHLSEKKVLSLLRDGATAHLDGLLRDKQWDLLAQSLHTLPKKIKQDPTMQYYMVKSLVMSEQIDRAVLLCQQAGFSDPRMTALVMELPIDMQEKMTLVTQAIVSEPDNSDLLYLLSYLHAQAGDVQDTVKMLENAIAKKS